MSGVEVLTLDEIIARGPPKFIEADPQHFLDRLVAKYEELSGRKLYDDQVEMFVFETAAYMLALRGEEKQAAFEQNLVAFGVDQYLDARAGNNLTYRLKESHAVTTLRFSLAAATPNQTILPAGTRVSSSDVVFATDGDLVIASGQLTGDVTATAATAGSAVNGFEPEAVNTILDPVAGVAVVVNIEETTGGADEESDDRLRRRAAHAHERISKAGPREGYRQIVFGVNSQIVSVGVIRPEPGKIDIYPLMADGIPSAAIKQEIADALSPEDVRPQGDDVTVKDPVAIDFTAVLTVQVDRVTPTVAAEVTATAQAIVDAWHLFRHSVQSEKKYHIAGKPVRLAVDLLQLSRDGDTVLDPFMGSGTTGLACIELDRKFVGVELDPAYFEITCDRLAHAIQ